MTAPNRIALPRAPTWARAPRLPLPAVLALLAVGATERVALAQDPGHYAETAERATLIGRRLRRTVAWLSVDAREGRRAGTPGELETVQWLAARLAEYQLPPAGEDGYLQPFEVPLPERDAGGSWIQAELRFDGPERVVPLPSSASGGCAGPLVYRGLGIRRAGEWDDYPGELAAGSIVLLVEGGPRGPAPSEELSVLPGASPEVPTVEHGRFGTEASPFHKIMTAARMGAAGVLLAPHPDAEDVAPAPFRPGLRASIPALRIRREVAQALFPGYADAARTNVGVDVTRGGPTGELCPRVELFADVERRRALAYNVLARIEGGEGPMVVVGAHLDHLGRGGEGSLAPGQVGEIHNGADDNASGVAVVLEMAYQLLLAGPPRGDVLLAFWSGEELGLLGSSYWAEHPTVPLEGIAACLNLDMVGRAGEENGSVLQVLGAGSSPAFAGWMAEAGERAGLDLRVDLSLSSVGGSDHQTFLRREIPALHLFSGLHADYHRPSDDFQLFQAEGAARVTDLALDLVARMQAAPSLPFSALKPPSESSNRGWSVSFGTVPDYTFEGPGLRLTGTTPGSPAERAGLEAGDIVLQVGDVQIEDIHSFVYMLQLYKPGDVVLTRFRRGPDERQLRVTLGER